MQQNRFLQLLKTRGPLTVSAIATEVGITGEGVRLQLVKLAKLGLIKSVPQSNGVGRPVQVFELTELGNSNFPDAHKDLSVELLNTITQQLGKQALDSIMSSREDGMFKRYQNEIADETSLENKISTYTKIRSKEGYMTEFKKEKDGQFLLIENHCPILSAANSCDGFCQSDLKIINRVLKENVNIERIEHIASGGRRCSYRIKEIGI